MNEILAPPIPIAPRTVPNVVREPPPLRAQVLDDAQRRVLADAQTFGSDLALVVNELGHDADATQRAATAPLR